MDPLLSLSVTLHANKGCYAVLLGSGVSRSAGIPTGWEVVLDLIRRVAALRTRSKRNTPEVNQDRRSPEGAVVSVSALLELVAWMRRRQRESQGGDRCENDLNGQMPAAAGSRPAMLSESSPEGLPPFADPAGAAERVVGGVPGGDAGRDAAGAQPGGGATVAAVDGPAGGVA